MVDIFDEVERQVQAALQPICNRWDDGGRCWDDGQWTFEVKEALTSLGKRLSYESRARDVDTKDGGEWLFDVTWRKVSRGYLSSISLICESEWATGLGLAYDFEKLLAGRADHKLMVMQSRTANAVENDVDSLIGRISRFQLTVQGERYMFACWVEEQNRFNFKIHVT